jgi:hypothetical protein
MDTNEPPLQCKSENDMTVEEFLESLPEEKRDMADFLYSRTPCRYGLREVPAPVAVPTSVVELSKAIYSVFVEP